MKTCTALCWAIMLSPLMIVGCSSGAPSGGMSKPPPPTLQSIAVTGATSLAVGQSQQLTATGTYSDGSTENLTSSATWSSSATAVATVSSAGSATAVGAGTSTIKAALSGITGSTTVTVSPALVSIAIAGTTSLVVGQSQQLTATGTYSDGSTQNLTSSATWSSSATAVATVSSGGSVTAVSAGTCTITATLSGAQGSAALTVNAKAVVSISITPGTQTLFLNSTLQFDAVATYNDGSVQDVTTATQWQSSAPSFVQVSNSGLVIAVAAGDATVSASNGTVVGSASVTVSSSNTGIAFIDDFTDSRLMLYWPGDGSVISYYGTRNSDGTIASITSATDSVAGQQPQTIVFDSQGEESTAILSDGTLIGFNWTANPTLVIIPPDQTGTAVIPLPAVTSAATVAADMHCSRTNAGCLSADARERNLAGTSPSSQYSQAISPEASGDATPSVAVTVTTDLGVGPKPEDNALVYVGIAYALGGSPVAPMPATETSPGTGVYTANLPSGPTALSPSVLQSSGAQALSTICKKIEALPNCGPKQTKCQIFTTLLTLVCDAQSVTQNYYTVLDLLNNLLPPVVAPNIVLNGCGMPQSRAAATGTYAFTAAAQCKPSQINVYLNPATVSVGGTIPLGATASWNSHQISSSALSWNWSAFSGSLQDSYLQISPRGTDTPEGWAGGKFSVAVADVLGQNPTPTDKPDIVTAVETNSDENGTDAITVQPTTLSLIVTWTVTGDVPTGWTGIDTLTMQNGNYVYTGTVSSGPDASGCVIDRTESGTGSYSVPTVPTPPAPFTFFLSYYPASWTNTAVCSSGSSSYGGSEFIPYVTIQATPISGGYTLTTNTQYPPDTSYGGATMTVTATGFLSAP